MSQIVIYHNPRCSKSRQTLELLREHDVEPRIVEYLNHPLRAEELRGLLKKLNKSAIEVIRTKEKVIAEEGLAIDSEDAALSAIEAHPVLLERPIVVKGDRAVIGRPPENVLELLKGK